MLSRTEGFPPQADHCSVYPVARKVYAPQDGGQFNRKRDFEKANTRLPCIVR
jgi:hypothetical protein